MRIHLPLHPQHFGTPAPSTASGPLAQIGGELVVIELQGELKYEGEKDGGVVGVLGLDRPDRPTLHVGAHHLLHGKIASLPRPYAVIRRVAAGTSSALDGDAEEEESDAAEEEEDAGGGRGGPSRAAAAATPSKPFRHRAAAVAADEEEEEDDGPLFPEAEAMATPARPRTRPPPSSSPWAPPSSARDYSSDLSSPAGALWPSSDFDHDDDDEDEDDEVETERKRAREEERAERERELRRRERRRAARPERTRHYEVVGVVRKKVVFALRPEPLVQPTPLPE